MQDQDKQIFCTIIINVLQIWGCFQSWDVIRGYFAHQSMLRPPSSSSLPPGAGGPPHLTGRGILLSNRLCKENFRSQVIFSNTIWCFHWLALNPFLLQKECSPRLCAVLYLNINSKWKWFQLKIASPGEEDNPWLENLDLPKVHFCTSLEKQQKSSNNS